LLVIPFRGLLFVASLPLQLTLAVVAVIHGVQMGPRSMAWVYVYLRFIIGAHVIVATLALLS